jgi:hypothetical protein
VLLGSWTATGGNTSGADRYLNAAASNNAVTAQRATGELVMGANYTATSWTVSLAVVYAVDTLTFRLLVNGASVALIGIAPGGLTATGVIAQAIVQGDRVAIQINQSGVEAKISAPRVDLMAA